jgi:hypothetical protein
MPHFDALPVDSEIIVSIGTPKHDRRLSDKILAAFCYAIAEGAPAVAAVLRRALEEAERDVTGDGHQRCLGGALVQADLWVEFIEARDFFRRAFGAEAPDSPDSPDSKELERRRAAMMDAYKRWSYS